MTFHLPFSPGIAIGGDSFPGSTLSDHCIRYQNIPQIKMIVVLGELGGTDEYSLVNALKEGKSFVSFQLVMGMLYILT
jgi:succinyl-CoA synthetase alpha subunit